MRLHVLTIFLLTLPFHGNTQNTNNPNQERTILLELKHHWSDPSSLTHWTPSSNHCTWPEVTCSEGGSVTGLAIDNGSLSQPIPPSICDLTNLNRIELQRNSIPGFFPTVLYNCSMLEYLDLSYNHLVGILPDSISNLSSRLHVLNLTLNNFTGGIPPAIGGLTSLRSIELTANLFDASFPSEIGLLSNLEHLVLNNNPFAPQSIPSSFGQLKKLKNLWMYKTNLIGEIPESFGNMSSLEFLDLSENRLTGSIPDSLFLLNNLSFLFLFKNRLSGSIPRTAGFLNMQVLDLSNNSLTGTIPDDFGKLRSLTGLALFFNQLSGEVPTAIGELPQLVNIGLYSNNLSGELPPQFGRYSKLERFQVSSNQFVGELPKYLCENKVLIGVIAFDNQLTGGLPDFLGDCESLQVIRVENNQLSGEVPGGLWRSKNLTTLIMSNNSFSGSLPDEVGSVLSLVDVTNNKITGSIPVGISSWEGLMVLKASNNLLNGGIPQELTALPSLYSLNLDGNQLSGSLPSSVVSWKSLSSLDLSGNQLSGNIPDWIGLLPDLNSLDLSRNEFSGHIPPRIGSRISMLNLSSNRLSGRIPGELENSAFERSFLNNSGLCSSVPSLGLSSCGGAKKSSKLSSGFIAAVSSVAAIVLLLVFLYTMYVYRREKQRSSDHSTWKLTSFQRLSFTEADILSGLTEENVIGSGGSGLVYRVPVKGAGGYVAVKRIWEKVNLDDKLEKEFVAEVGILGTFRHSNIVKLLCCISSDNFSKLLVYENMENCSLDRWIHGRKKRSNEVVLDWPKRLHIAIGAAQGLCYMHHHCSPPIVHRDIKSSNILLDSEFNAKIADFGLATMLINHGVPNTMSVVAGSFGYMAPEYAHTRRVNEKIDVYGFGVILLELLTGREAHDGDESSSLAQWAWQCFQQGKPIVDALDEDVKDPIYLDDINIVLKLGLLCTSTSPSRRPPIKDVLQILLGCSHRLPLSDKSNRHEYEVAPLLQSSKSERSDDINVFISI